MEILRRKLLLHSCCAPCSVFVANELQSHYDVACFFYNPNIDEPEEYEKRLGEMKNLSKLNGIFLIVGDYLPQKWREKVSGMKNEPEGGIRCRECFKIRLRETARIAKQEGYNLFATTLTVAPMKNHIIINEIGENVSKEFQIEYLPSNFKKKDGFRKSMEMAKKFGLYRQNYCGCSFSKKEITGIKGKKDKRQGYCGGSNDSSGE